MTDWKQERVDRGSSCPHRRVSRVRESVRRAVFCAGVRMAGDASEVELKF